MVIALSFGILIVIGLMMWITDGADRRNEYLEEGNK